ncbi:MAG TPA: 4Fe-4S binding protein [Candidatus Bathyarchaeia archaeon]|nr:MAG: 4Fe-4S ferredoxin [Candidatus Bathyarchaeota archaeon RBG_16_48_13]HJX23640.1 4Fe-4S binding protein [Candidatus Bathyarchaeia archaeon]
MTQKDDLTKKPVNVDDILKVDLYDVEETPHISVNFDRCIGCETKPCIDLCPAKCYDLLGGKVLFSYSGCLECGTCRIVCPQNAISWNYPRSGKGIQYRFT